MKEKQLWRRREREWNRRRGWRLRGRQTDHNQAETGRQLWEQNLILQYKHTNTHVCRRRHTHTHVCTYTHAHHHGLKGAHTHAHTIQKSHITHEILMVQSNRQKWRWVDRRKTQGEDSGGKKKERWMKAICLYCQCPCDIWTISKRIYMESSLLAWACSTCTNYLFPSLVFYLFHRDTKEGHPEC